VDEAVNEDYELVKFDNHGFLKDRPTKDVKGESISNSFSNEKIIPPQDESLNEPQQDE
jgi:hypothetical protein